MTRIVAIGALALCVGAWSAGLGVSAAAPARGSQEGEPPSFVHAIKSGDTLSALARRYGVSVATLVRANGLSGPGAILRIGQALLVPGRQQAASRPASGTRPGPDGKVKRAVATNVVGRAGPLRRPTPQSPSGLTLDVPDFGDQSPSFGWPAEGPVSSSFGLRKAAWHGGLDIRADMGAPVLAAAPGIVVASHFEPGYGRVVKIEHSQGFLTVYAHNLVNRVRVGSQVAGGDVIALVGRSGRSTGPHLHFEVRHYGIAYNPLYVLPWPSSITAIDDSLAPGSLDEAD